MIFFRRKTIALVTEKAEKQMPTTIPLEQAFEGGDLEDGLDIKTRLEAKLVQVHRGILMEYEFRVDQNDLAAAIPIFWTASEVDEFGYNDILNGLGSRRIWHLITIFWTASEGNEFGYYMKKVKHNFGLFYFTQQTHPE